MTKTLNLSVMHDGDSYRARQRIARDLVGEFSLTAQAKALRGIVSAQAAIERKEFGSKFSARDISEACLLVAESDREEVVSNLRWAVSQGSPIAARGRKWFDSINGNTYHTVRIVINGESVNIPTSYGYGDQWRQTATEWLIKNNVIPHPGYWDAEKRNPKLSEFPINWDDAPYGLKRDL